MGDDEPILAGKKVLEKGKTHRGQTKLDQQRIQTSRGGICKADGVAREPQSAEGNIESGPRGNQDSQRGPSPEDTEEIRRLEQQELAFWRRSASKRLAGWTRDGSTEEIAGWMMDAQRLNKEVEAKTRKLQETIERESLKDDRMDDAMDGLDGSLSS